MREEEFQIKELKNKVVSDQDNPPNRLQLEEISPRIDAFADVNIAVAPMLVMDPVALTTNQLLTTSENNFEDFCSDI